MMSKLTLVIGNKNHSSWSLRPWLLLKHFEIPFSEVLVPLFQDHSKQELLKYAPTGKVPVLLDGSLSIWDSQAIAEYLAERFSDKPLWPRDPAMRAHARSICAEMHSSFLALRKTYPMNVTGRITKPGNPDADRDVSRVLAIWQDCRGKHQAAGPFLFGEFSIADAFYAPVVFRFQTYGIVLTGPARQYFQTMLALPAMKQWQAAAQLENYPWPDTH